MTTNQFRATVKQAYPHITLKVRTVSFSDLARAERKALTITGARTQTELSAINQLAQTAGLLPDTSVRMLPL